MKKRKLNKIKVSIVIILSLLLFTTIVFGRYIYNSIKEQYFLSRKFYFTSDILTSGQGAKYEYNTWNGIGTFKIEFNLQSFQNEFEKLDYDLNYDISCSTTSEKVECSLNVYDYVDNPITQTTGTILKETNKQTVVLYVKAKENVVINENEEIKVNVIANTIEPYKKQISCEFTLRIRPQSETQYVIKDEIGKEYFTLQLTNIKQLGIKLELKFDPNLVRIDMNNPYYINSDKTLETVTNINGKKYVNKSVIILEKESSKKIKFYKQNKNSDYSYDSTVVKPGQESIVKIKVIA